MGKTQKKRIKKKRTISIKHLKLTNEQKDEICKEYQNIYKPFESKLDKSLQKRITSKNYDLETVVIKNLKQAITPSKFTANDDYYSYINYRWLNNLELSSHQKYITQVDDFRLIQDKVYRELIDILEKYLTDPITKNTKLGRCMKNAYESFKTHNTNKQTMSVANLFQEHVNKIMTKESNLWKMLAEINKNEIISWGAPFVWSINPDDKDPSIYKCYLQSPQLTLLDIDTYFDNKDDSDKIKKYKNRNRSVYFEYLHSLFEMTFGSGHGFDTRDVYHCEIDILIAMGCNLVKENENGYNLIKRDEALNKYGFDWDEFCKELGFKKIPNEFITSNLNYLICGTKMLKEKWNTKQWKTYWIYLYIRQQSRWNESGFMNYYKFQGKFLRGQQELVDLAIVPIFCMGFTFNTFLTEQYILHYKNERGINYVKNMAEDLKHVFIRIIKRNNWMASKTKKTAMDKLQNIKFEIEKPKNLRPDPLLDYKADDTWGNLEKMAIWRSNQSIKLIDKNVIDIPNMNWSVAPAKFISKQSYVVNAMYTPTENSIYIPLGYIQKPFVDLDERGIEYNLAYIGFTIAHELSHSLDDLGSKYNKYGQLDNWWTPKDDKMFKEIQKNIIKQYEIFASYDEIDFDAAYSIGEDLADIVGFSICEEYLRDFQQKSNAILPIQFLSFKAFFVYFASQFKQKISKKAIAAQLKTNPHPLDKYRCNVPLSRSRIFRTVYKLKKGDKMWWNSFKNVW